MNDGAVELLPQYKCHKKVRAAKITSITLDATAALIENRDTDGTGVLGLDGSSRCVQPEYLRKHAPAVGGYYVLYEDGYESFSPARSFEEGYTRI